ncbi:prisilkin-39-like [Archocentrus centrarchus]|uniref:prisilkin-39-like n=1 Tax=Archocentrus centrarchus TaxID=63155 RepID=UPI0011EA4CC4|nr:prisilkin-39-like [Archocentrus centrarchus]XP_030598096.1 prisilkin-39-like [Archocentrus centrarchus]
MGRLCEMTVVSLLIMALLNTELTWAKRGSSSRGKSSSSTNKGWTNSKTSNTQPGNYPRQPQSPNRNTNPYPAGGSYPFPKQNQPSYPGAGSNPNQSPGRVNPGGYPNQNPAGGYPAGGYPAAGGNPNQNPGRGNYPNQYPPAGYPNQNPAGGYPAGGYPAGGYPAAGGNPNQYPGRGNYPNQYPPAGGYPNQYPGRAGTNPGGYPNQYPAGGGYPNQSPGRNYPYQYPGGYPVQTGNTRPGWNVPGTYPGGYPGGAVGGYPNWNPSNKILSPRFGGGGYGYGGYGMGGSPFSRSVQGMGHMPKSTGFAKKAMMAAGVGALAGMAVGYGLGRFPRPHFTFRNPEEEYYYNNYMYRRYGSQSTDQKDFSDYVYKLPPRAETYEAFMSRCMNSTNSRKDQGSSTSKSGAENEDDDTVSIEEIGYPALIEQVKSRRCVEEYMKYSEQFMQERKAEQQYQPSRCSPLSYGLIHLLTSSIVLLSSMLLLQ